MRMSISPESRFLLSRPLITGPAATLSRRHKSSEQLVNLRGGLVHWQRNDWEVLIHDFCRFLCRTSASARRVLFLQLYKYLACSILNIAVSCTSLYSQVITAAAIRIRCITIGCITCIASNLLLSPTRTIRVHSTIRGPLLATRLQPDGKRATGKKR